MGCLLIRDSGKMPRITKNCKYEVITFAVYLSIHTKERAMNFWGSPCTFCGKNKNNQKLPPDCILID